ncbi:MAG: NUDIX domain-containing protein [Planctomycetota bacterium]
MAIEPGPGQPGPLEPGEWGVFDDVPNLRVWIPRGPQGVRLVVDPSPPDARDHPEIQATWRQLCQENPKLFDGPIYRVTDATLAETARDGPALHVVVDGFHKVAVAQRLGAQTPGGATMLASVIGALHADDERGQPHLLLGKRSHETRVFGGLWEAAPAGGIDPTLRPGARCLDADDLLEQVRVELPEETGLPRDLAIASHRIVCVAHTPCAFSYDVVMVTRAERTIAQLRAMAGERNWEYDDLQWLSRDDAAAFDRDHAHDMIPQLRALLRVLGWIGS